MFAFAGCNQSDPMEDTITVYDPDTKVYTEIPESELAPGMVRANVEGRDGDVWIDPSQLKQSEYRHPPFEGERREQIVAIQNSFPGVYEKTYEFWEDGFRRDMNPEREIAVWLHIADVYGRYSADNPQVYRDELFSLVLACSNADAQRIDSVFTPNVLSDEDFRLITSSYYAE